MILFYKTIITAQLLHDALVLGDKRPSFSTLVRSISISLEAMADYLHLGPAVAETETTESAV